MRGSTLPIQNIGSAVSRSRAVSARLAGWGALAGVVAAAPVGLLLAPHPGLGGGGSAGLPVLALLLAYPPAVGVAIGLVTAPRPRGAVAFASAGLVTGLLGWLVCSLTLDPWLRGRPLDWSIASAAAGYRVLVADLVHGGLTALLVCLVLSAGAGRVGTGGTAGGARPRSPARVVIVGGGFAGVSAAKRFERLALRHVDVDVTLVGSSNFLLFTPMLAEVASGALEPAHISAPVRASATHTRFRNRTVAAIDTDRKLVELAAGAAPAELLPYDHLVVAVGSVPHFFDLPGVEEHAMTLKDLHDATALRGHVLEQLERADNMEPDPDERRRMLAFVVAGGGFAGAEAVAELFDLVHGVLRFFPGIAPDEPRFVLVHSQERILPELSAELGDYAMRRLGARGIEFRLTAKVVGATATQVWLDDGDRIPTRTFLWAAGNRPSPLVESIGGEHDRGGALVTDGCFRVSGLRDVWAAGDCARIPDEDGGAHPPTAQHAIREGKALADNVAAVLRGRTPREFRFRTIGVLVALGHRTAAAEIRGHRFSGFAAWMMWRAIYLAKLPGVEKRVRVFLDWMIDLVLPRDIVVTHSETPRIAERA